MVGRKTGGGDQRQDVPLICVAQGGLCILSSGACVSERRCKALAQRARSPHRCPKCGATPEALSPTELYDPLPSGAVSVVCPRHPAPCPILHSWLVHREPSLRNRR